jgi:uncharacterized protein (DUF4415 family)/uncharacterized DUF497 family protein
LGPTILWACAFFAWDETKDRINRRKHLVSVETATQVFDDPNAVTYADRVIDGEKRWHTLGLVGIEFCWPFAQLRSKMAKKKFASSPREKRLPASEIFTRPLTDRQRRELQGLRDMPDSKIDLSDAPSVEPLPSEVQVGRFYRPIKQLVSIRLDADVLAWFRSRGKKYQTYMNNEVLRREMQTHPRGR